MLFAYDGKSPLVAAESRIAPNAVLSGEVTVGRNCSVGFGAVLTAESGPINVGDNCVVMDGAILRGIRDHPLTIGENVLIGPHAYLTGCMIERNAFIATGAVIFNGAVVGERSEVRINAIVHIRTRLLPGAIVPLGWIAVGDPAEILPPEAHARIWDIQKALDFPRYVFGVERPREGATIMPEIMPRYARFLIRRHGGDGAGSK
jgi:carbonic anhydrase/acetyltransferase-like protein (isoleucine patch superfamily)